MVELAFLFKTALFEHVLKKINTFTFWCMVIFLGHIRFTPSEGSKAFKKKSLRSQTMEIGP